MNMVFYSSVYPLVVCDLIIDFCVGSTSLTSFIKCNVTYLDLIKIRERQCEKDNVLARFLYPLQTLFVVGILFSCCPSVRVCVLPCVRPSVTLCFLNILKSHGWIFIKPCKHVHICKTNALNKKVRARGQFYESYFPL